MTAPTREAWIGAMAKHLPPSGAALRLLDVGGASGDTLLKLRPDLEILPLAANDRALLAPPESSDAIAVFDQPLTPELLASGWRALRAGGRLIALLLQEQSAESWVALLEAEGYVRILVEPALADSSSGVLIRGEKPHTTADTLERIRVASARDDALTDLERYPGRFLYLLVRQSPNKPAWALRAGESVAWNAVIVSSDGQSALLAFSSLAKAVAFMQPAVLAGEIRDINKVAKYRVEVAKGWAMGVILNPPDGFLADKPSALHSIDPSQAEAPGE